MAYPSSPSHGKLTDVLGWINTLPPFGEWGSTSTMSLCFCSSSSSAAASPSMNLLITRSSQTLSPYITFSISADVRKLPIPLWTATPLPLESKAQQSLSPDDLGRVFLDVVNGVLAYGPCKKPSSKPPAVRIGETLKDMFNLTFLTLAFLVCTYEAPEELRLGSLESMKAQLAGPKAREASKQLVRLLGSNLEEQWMRTFGLAIANWITELQASGHRCQLRTPSPLFSYAASATGLWKVQLYCPTIAMASDSGTPMAAHDERLLFTLQYQQLEGVIQLAYKAVARGNWIDVAVGVDNVRCDVVPLVSETLMAKRGYGPEEKYFPSRISLQITPTMQSSVMSVTVRKSSDNPAREVGFEKSLEGAFDPPNHLGLTISALESVTVSMKPWKFEQDVHGDSARLEWFLHGGGSGGKEVFSSRPSKLTLLQPRAWFKDRYSNPRRPFTKQGGVVFAGDEYGEEVWWKVCSGAAGKKMEWEIKGNIWLTYWPNKHKSFHTETRRLEFKELLCLSLPSI